MQTEIERLRAERAQQTKDEERLRYAIEIGAGTLRRLRAALEDVRERVQEIANRYHEQHFVIDTVARLLCETIPAALAGDAKHEVVRLGDGATYCPGCTVTFPVEIGPVVAGSGENIAGTFTVGPVVPAEAAPNIAESNDRADDALSILRDLNDIASDFGGYVPPDKIVQALKRAGIKPHDYVAMVADVRALTSAPPPATPAYEWRISRTADLSGEGWEECEPPDGRIEEFRDHRFWRRVRAANQPGGGQ